MCYLTAPQPMEAMRLVKQTTLYYKEGNSDKVYEISLCDVGGNTYVVNFRYGKRGGQLKEGTKTPAPVALATAEGVFDALETEKLNKGYTTTEGAPVTPKASSATTAVKPDESLFPLSESWKQLPAGRNKAILRRLHAAVTGEATGVARNWKLSRVIWKAGEYHIQEATPYLIRLFNTGNALQQYCCLWAMVRSRSTSAIPVLQLLYKQGSVQLSRLAGAGLLQLLEGVEKQNHLNTYVKALPEAFQELYAEGLPDVFLQERLEQPQTDYKWLTTLYLIATQNLRLKQQLKTLLLPLILKPPYFKQFRVIFKLAELLDDFDMLGMLSCKTERDQEMYKHYLSYADAQEEEVYVAEIEDWITPRKESKKAGSRIAFSNRTKWYLHRRTLRRLKMLGNAHSTDYVKLATAVLIAYERDRDVTPYYSEYNYEWKGREYVRVETRFPNNSQAIYLHQILSADHPDLTLVSGRWKMRNPDDKKPVTTTQRQPGAANAEGGGLLKKLAGLFGRKKTPDAAVPTEQPEAKPEIIVAEVPNENGTPYLGLWNAMPQAYVQLLMQAQVNEIHRFAIENLTVHPQYAAIKQKLDKEAIKLLLLSPYPLPASFGRTMAEERYTADVTPDSDVIIAMLNSIDEAARATGRGWAGLHKGVVTADPDFITCIAFNSDAGIRQWGRQLLATTLLDERVKQAAAGKVIVFLLGLTPGKTIDEALIKEATDWCFTLLAQELKQVSAGVLSDMLQHPVTATLLFGLRLLQHSQVQAGSLSEDFIYGLLLHSYQPVREAGVALLNSLHTEELLQKQHLVMMACIGKHEDVRKGIAPIAGRMAHTDAGFGNKLVEALLPYLLRKETIEGLQLWVSELLCNELTPFLKDVDKQAALRLLYSTFAPAQQTGAFILEKYTDPAQLTMPQIVALGSHENVAVREWCQRLYNQQVARIRYEKDESLQLLNSKWDDMRAFAREYFLQHFTAEDWTVETLVALADNVKPDIEAYGRELITRFFKEENGETYLLKLSQHPSEKMQLFATNYLERFAADNLERIQQLEFYFRSVLTRVNKSRVAKKRIYHFLYTEGVKHEAAARLVGSILSDISATMAIGDKAKCIEILLQLQALYQVQTPLTVKETEVR